MTSDMPEEIWVVNGADDPALEFTAMRKKEYEGCVKYTRSDISEKTIAILEQQIKEMHEMVHDADRERGG